MNRFAPKLTTGEQAGFTELAKANALLNGIISSAMDAIITIDAEQRILLFNPAAELMFGVSTPEVLGHDISRFIPERFRAAHTRHVEEFTETGVSMRRVGALGTVRGLRVNGEEFPIEASISHVDIQGEKLYTVILRDIGERQQAEQKLQAAMDQLVSAKAEVEESVEQRTIALNQTVGDLEAFSYSLSHDLRSPLRAIRGLMHIFLEDYGTNLVPEGAELLKKVADEGERMDWLISDLLSFSRMSLQPIEFQLVEPEKLILGIIGGRVELQPPRAKIKIESPLLAMRGHAASLTLCLANLLGNAAKFVAPGVVPQVGIHTESMAGNVRLWVQDNGIGISQEGRQRIFAIFQRLHTATEYEGSGMGLAIVRKAVERMGGTVGLESEPGRGSRFWIELPGC